MVAIFVGSSEIVKLLLQYPELDLNVRDLRRKTPIHLAASIGSLEILRALLDRKELDPNSKDAEGLIFFSFICFVLFCFILFYLI